MVVTALQSLVLQDDTRRGAVIPSAVRLASCAGDEVPCSVEWRSIVSTNAICEKASSVIRFSELCPPGRLAGFEEVDYLHWTETAKNIMEASQSLTHKVLHVDRAAIGFLFHYNVVFMTNQQTIRQGALLVS